MGTTLIFVAYDKIKSYTITDTLDAGLSYVTGNDSKVAITLKDKNGNAINDYTLSGIESVYDKTDTSKVIGHKFSVTIPWINDDGTLKYESPNSLELTYSAKVTNEAVIADGGNKNTASFSYLTDVENPDDPDPSHQSTDETVTTYVYALAINKIDPTGAGLEGATFTLKDANDTQIQVKATDTDGIYEFDPTDYTAGDVEGKPNYNVVSPKDGVIIIKGVEAGTYTLTETEAPAGYNRLPGTKEITASIAETTSYTRTITIYKDADGNVVDTKVENGSEASVPAPVPVSAINVVNNAGTELPSTGGMGTTMFYILGAGLMIGAVVLLVTRRRMDKE